MTLRIRAYALSDVGRSRAVNEDSFAIESGLGLYLVADGMGGHGHGDVASRLAVDTIRDSIRADLDGRRWSSFLRRLGGRPERLGPESLRRAFVYANERLLRAVDEEQALAGMGTTVVALLADGPRGAVAHVGDSRAYRLRGGSLDLLTHDHTWVAEQVTAGNLSEDQARVHPFKSVVTRALGGERDVTVELRELGFAPGDLYLLCSDGLTGMVSDEQIYRRLIGARSLASLCAGLVADANEGGGRDNITALALAAEER